MIFPLMRWHRGLLGGTKADFEAVNAFLDEKKIRLDSVVDRKFSFEEAPAAFEYLWSGAHVGKVVIKVT
jgi:NADPH-dependent curcumin reductase CurA